MKVVGFHAKCLGLTIPKTKKQCFFSRIYSIFIKIITVSYNNHGLKMYFLNVIVFPSFLRLEDKY